MLFKSYEANAIRDEFGIQVFNAPKIDSSGECIIHGNQMRSFDVNSEMKLIYYCNICQAFFIDESRVEALKDIHQRGKYKFISMGSYKLLFRLNASFNNFIHFGKILRFPEEYSIYSFEYNGCEYDEDLLLDNILSYEFEKPRCTHRSSEYLSHWNDISKNNLKENITTNNSKYFHMGIDTIDGNGDTILIWAARRNLFELIPFLLDFEVDIALTNNVGNTALVESAKNNNVEIVKLLANDKNISSDRKDEIDRALFCAIGCSCIETVIYLAEILARYFKNTKILSSALFFATWNYIGKSAPEIITALLDVGADPNVADEFGRTPLHLAVRYSTIPIIKMLIGYGADVDKLDLYGNGALIYSIHDEEKILELLRAGANINVRYGDGKTLLTKAVMDEDYRTMEMLLRLRINPNIKDLAGYPPLYYAKEKNNNKSINLLVSYGAKEWSATIEEEDYE